jgi:DNA-binding transcriptional LysR family regulator
VALSIDELRAFVVAVDLGSVGRAARALGVTQSALSKRIKSLELSAGTPVLERTATGVRPSAAGLGVLDDARRLLAQADALEAKLAAQSKISAPVRIAASPALAERVVPAAIATLEVGQVGLPIELLVANSTEVRRAVDEGRVDIGVAAVDLREEPGVGARLLGDDELVVAMPADDEWAQLDAVPVELLAERRLVLRDPASNARQLLERALGSVGLMLAPPVLEVGSPAAVKAAVRAARAPGVLSKHAVGPIDEGLAVRPISGADVRRRFWVLLAPGAAPAAAGIVDGLVAHPIS